MRGTVEENGIRRETMQNPINCKEHKEALLQPFFLCDLCIIRDDGWQKDFYCT